MLIVLVPYLLVLTLVVIFILFSGVVLPWQNGLSKEYIDSIDGCFTALKPMWRSLL